MYPNIPVLDLHLIATRPELFEYLTFACDFFVDDPRTYDEAIDTRHCVVILSSHQIRTRAAFQLNFD